MRFIITAIFTLLFSSTVLADCSYELFSISSTKNTKIIDFIEELSDLCLFSIVVNDPYAEKILDKNLNKTNINNTTIEEIFSLILKENNLTYTFNNTLLKISYLETKMFNIDYILSQRKSESKTNITLSSEGNINKTKNRVDFRESNAESTGRSGMKVDSSDEVAFWHKLDLEFQEILNGPQDLYKAQPPIINKNAGIITLTATLKQIERFEQYLKKLQDKVNLQVLIDVQLLSVNLSDAKTTGVDWSQLYALQNIDISIDKLIYNNIAQDSNTTSDTSNETSHLIKIGANGKLNEVIKFLKTQGDVTSISNPKVLTLNNQAALITSGTEYFYKIISTETLSSTASATQSKSEDLQSVFAGVLLDITPEISDNETITLKINPSLSETTYDISNTNSLDRTMPPDLRRRQLSSVVTIKDGERIILGGLINSSNGININKVPILGDIPIVNYLFKYENRQKIVQELVIVIQPHIIRKQKSDLSLSALGYEGISEAILLNAKDTIIDQTKEKN